MIEKTLITYLSGALDVPVFMGEKPSTKPGEYVVIRYVDGGRVNMIDSASFICESYSTSLQKAAELNDLVKTAMYNAVSVASISAAKCTGGGQNIDTVSKTYCYECVFNVYYF